MEPENTAAPPERPANLPERPDDKGCDIIIPVQKNWYEVYRGATVEQGIVLIPIVAWGYRSGDGSRVGLTPPLSGAPEGFFFFGYVAGDQIFDFEQDEEGSKVTITTYDTAFQKMQLNSLSAIKTQQERAAAMPPDPTA